MKTTLLTICLLLFTSQFAHADPIGKAINQLYGGVINILAPLGENEVRNIDDWLTKIAKDEYNYYSNKSQTNNLMLCEDKNSFDDKPVWSNCYASYVLSKDFREYYIGELENNLMHGFGVAVFDKWEEAWREECFENKILDGTFNENEMNLYKFPETMLIHGVNQKGNTQFCNTNRRLSIPQNGVSPKLHMYVGEWKSGKRHGKGKLYFNDPNSEYSKYCEMKDKTKYYFRDLKMYMNNPVLACKEKNYYAGEWKSGKRHGKGLIVYEINEFYDGEWVSDQREGFGTEKYKNGEIYIGQWKNNKQHGKGKLKLKDGSILEAIFFKGKSKGKSVLKKASGEIINEFYDGKCLPREIKYEDGKLYKGCLKENLRTGIGTMVYPNGEYYKGSWVNGLRWGKGTYTYENGIILKGLWSKNEAILTKSYLIFPDGTKLGFTGIEPPEIQY